MRVQRKQIARCGYTLIEVLVALLVVGIVLPVAMQGISLATTLGGDARLRTRAAALAQMKLQELVISGAWQVGQLAGDFQEIAPGSAGYQWQATLGDWSGGNMRELAVTVTWSRRGHERRIVLTTLVDPGTY